MLKLSIDNSSIIRPIEKIIMIKDVLQGWIDSKQLVKSSLIVGNSKIKPKLLIDSKNKTLTIDGIEFLKDGNTLKITAKEYEKLQDLIMVNYYA